MGEQGQLLSHTALPPSMERPVDRGEAGAGDGREMNQALALHYLGLLLRVDPQLKWFKVVAGNEPFLMCDVTESERGKQRCAHQHP